MTSDEVQDVLAKPESMLGARVRKAIIETIEKETQRALQENDEAYFIELQRAKKLINRGCWKIREANPYIVFMGECLTGTGGTLLDTQKAMQECAQKWSQLPEEKKKEYRILAGRQAVYDYL